MGRTGCLLAIVWLASSSVAQTPNEPATGLQRDVVLSEYSPLSRSVEVARRVLTPLVNLELARASARAPVRTQAIELARERFVVYLPTKRPTQGYGLLAFIPPWQDAHLPAGWAAILDQHGMLFVSAAKSGNGEDVIDRRIPLALLGAYNMTQLYRIDGDRIYIGGFSGGARVAMKVALAYPDFFRGALLNAGSDPIGQPEAVLPPIDQFGRFQQSSRIIYVTGTEDGWNIQHDDVSRDSMSAWCVFGTEALTTFRVGHEIADPYALNRALSALDRRVPVDARQLSTCRARTAEKLASELRKASEFVDDGKLQDARGLLRSIDGRYAGLASAEILALEQRIASQR